MSRLSDLYNKQIRNEMQEKFGYTNVMDIPKLEKIVINIGVGEATENTKTVDAAASDLEAITGQKPMICKAHKSLAAWKIREGMPLGCKVTLRGERMYEFLDRLINIALPRVRDFRGISSTSFDGRGNYAFGVKEQLIFPEIDFEKIDRVRGMDIIVVTTAKTDEEARELLTKFGMPFKK
ncbi:50S ribosomal protein L5 [Allisonella histaminiformans]|uniref:Large ribosomal subunit protein uL5 n=1 Tax=Allisonella histaminiformans TaxID=209880 RepID=A0A1G5V2N8_9FIRM|nr:50S ribosomal protein L5 [Allisonella histaminiformans]PWL47230.1 MAG: 50S ribosomal protein L5 [Veillonellaceae bacterium]MCI6003488.1 50S ribosomal protein L5 [Allisonella histaminiformans]MDD6870908.1 50S ribosomal protein L5 [Allisonella histaminiformans]MDY3956586.1 50S ribosomal protein L5 [Allisonella histaminiformans]SDA40141.1 large subunit ribosomal protein L5 [Allisonella histaminiformans]